MCHPVRLSGLVCGKVLGFGVSCSVVYDFGCVKFRKAQREQDDKFLKEAAQQLRKMEPTTDAPR